MCSENRKIDQSYVSSYLSAERENACLKKTVENMKADIEGLKNELQTNSKKTDPSKLNKLFKVKN